MKPVLFELFNIKIYSYTFFTNLGLLAGVIIFILESVRKKIDIKIIIIILAAGFIGTSFGSKIPMWIYNYKIILNDFSIKTLVDSGRTVVGGIIGGWIFIEITKLILNIKIKTGDMFAPGAALGLAIGRIGCFLGGCCYGTATDLPWACDFGDGVMRHPTQIYSSFFDLLLFIFLWSIRKKVKNDGDLFKIFLLVYFVFRFFIEFIRTSPRITGLTGFQITSIFVLIYLLVQFIIYRFIFEHNNEATRKNKAPVNTTKNI